MKKEKKKGKLKKDKPSKRCQTPCGSNNNNGNNN